MNLKELISMCETAMEQSDTPESAVVTIVVSSNIVNKETWDFLGIEGKLRKDNGKHCVVDFNAAKLHAAATGFKNKSKEKINV